MHEHPLAAALIERLRERNAYVLEIGSGSGRNTAALQRAGLRVHALADGVCSRLELPAQTFDGALSTHAFLHGTPSSVEIMLHGAALALKPAAPFYCTFASTRDSRYGRGTLIEAHTYAPQSGDEAGVAHVYFDRERLRALVETAFIIESLTEEDTDDVVGTWAHSKPPSGTVHWFLRARRRDQ